MNKKKLVILPTLTISLIALTLSSIAQVGIEEATRLAWSYELEGISVKIYVPSQAYPGDVVPINVEVNATVDLLDVYVILQIFGSKYKNCSDWNSTSFNVLWNEDLGPGEGISEPYNLEVPADADPGLVYGHIICKWMTLDLQDHSKFDSFSLTYLRNEEFEQLQEMYNALNETYGSLLGNYTELKSKYDGELGTARNLMYVFVATTVVSAATAFLLLIRRPKTLWT